MRKTTSCALAITSFFLVMAACPAQTATYFVSPAGNDAYDGTVPAYVGGTSGPVKTIRKGAALVKAGDTLYLRAGAYQETVVLSTSGTESAPITISSYPGEWAAIDGGFTLPASEWGTLFHVNGSYNRVKDLEVRNSNWLGLVIAGYRGVVENIHSHHNMETGILLQADNTQAVNCKVWWNAKRNEYGKGYPTGGWATGISAARHPRDATIRNCIVWNNWGEGLSTFESENVTLEDNIVYDNQTNIYISDAVNCTCQRNLVYSTLNNIFTNSSGLQAGIMMGDERYNPPSSGNKVINNLCIGNKLNFYWWQGGSGGGLVNTIIAHNTFVNSVRTSGMKIAAGAHSNTQIVNNIVFQADALPVAVIDSRSGLTLSHNLWSKSPPTNAAGTFDVIGDPLLAMSGSVLPGKLTPDYFKITSGSPAMKMGLFLADVNNDFFKFPRGSHPAIGAHELGSINSLSPGAPVGLRIISYY